MTTIDAALTDKHLLGVGLDGDLASWRLSRDLLRRFPPRVSAECESLGIGRSGECRERRTPTRIPARSSHQTSTLRSYPSASARTSDDLDLLGGLEPVSTDIRTGLCPRAGIPAGKMFAEARDRGGVLGDNGRFPAAETALSRVPGAKATESQKTIPTAPGKRLCVGLRGGGV